MTATYPPLDPRDHGLLDAGAGNLVYWEVSGNPDGKPALVVHGGPGSGSMPGNRRVCDPGRYRIVLLDQRGCGRSTPHASDPATDMRHNTTDHLIADMERLRAHLGIERWLLTGWSWGSTLILAYAERHPHRVSEIVMHGVSTSRRSDIGWLYGGIRRFFPEAWERFRAGVPEADRDGDLVAAYARLMEHPDPLVRDRAANAWCDWESAILSLETGGPLAPSTGRPPAAQLAFVRIAAHYFSHGAWLEEGALLRDAGRLAGIPGVLVQGRRDMGGTETPWLLARSWPGAEVTVIEDAGHLGSPALDAAFQGALDRFATT
ncbi:MAG TPA: prolyl aminopeptidase [Streptosporangiaceae bacterium]